MTRPAHVPHTLLLQTTRAPTHILTTCKQHTRSLREITDEMTLYMYSIAFDAATMAVFVSNDSENASQRMNEELTVHSNTPVCAMFP
jgi:hypothetical protein